MVATLHVRRALALIPLLAANFAAQAVRVGEVGDIRVVGERQGCSGGLDVSGANVLYIRRGPNELTVQMGEEQRTFVGDEYRVHRNLDVELRIDRMGSGKLILAPQILCPLRDMEMIRSYATPDTGVYAFSTHQERKGIFRTRKTYLTFHVSRGGAFVQWNDENAPLFVNTGAEIIKIEGTEIVIAVADPGRLAFLYVREGTVSFPAAAELTARPNELWQLRSDDTPRKLSILPGELSRLMEIDINHHLAGFKLERPRQSGRSFWRRPSTYLIAGGLAAAAYAVWPQDTSPAPRRRHTGTAVVLIPL